MPEIGLLGSEGGATSSVVPTPIAPAEWLGPIISKVHTNDSTLTRNENLLVSSCFLEGFLDSNDGTWWSNCLAWFLNRRQTRGVLSAEGAKRFTAWGP